MVKPSLVFLDEPTSGLDSFSAVQVCKVLKKVAESGAAVLFTIHQPSSKTFSSFDRLILMHKAKIMFQGAVKDVPDAFARNGFPIPNQSTPVDFIVEVTQSHTVAELADAGFFLKDERELAPARRGESRSTGAISTRWQKQIQKEPRVGFYVQLSMLMDRELKNIRRNFAAWQAWFGLTVYYELVDRTDLSPSGGNKS